MSYSFPALTWTRGTVPQPHLPVTPQDLSAYKVEVRRYDQLDEADQARWTRLGHAARDGNVFAQPWFVNAAIAHCANVPVYLVIVARAGDGEWIGVLPTTRNRRFGRWPIDHWEGWLATNQFLGVPLAIIDTAAVFWAKLLRHLDQTSRGEMLLHLRQIALDDPVVAALVALCQQQRRTIDAVDYIRRDAYCAATALPLPSARYSKASARLKSLRARLERDHGPVTIDLLPHDQSPDAWIATFLAMEHSGWKGTAASAIASAAGTEQMFQSVITHGHAQGVAQLARLSANGKPIAVSSWFVSGAHGAGFKMAYDEGYRHYAPGRLLMWHVAQHVIHSPITQFDTCARPAKSHCETLWPHKREILDCAIAIGTPAKRLMADAVLRARGMRRTITGARLAMQQMTHC